jgi:hypothetical protein
LGQSNPFVSVSSVAKQLLLLRLTPGERLGHIDVGMTRHRVAELLPVADLLSIDEDDHVGANRSLLIEDVGARLWVPAEDCLQRLTHRLGFDSGGRAVHMALNVRGK